MVFNVGARRSGTFWLQRIVTAHPEVAEMPSETHFFSHGIAPLFERFGHGVKDSPQLGQIWIERERLLDATRAYCDEVFSGYLGDATYLAERTPVHVFHLDLIADLYPDGRIVHIIRDGREVARSLVAKRWGPDTIEEAAQEWKDSILSARRARVPERFVEVRYEDLRDDPATHIARLFEGLGVPVSDEVLAAAVGEAGAKANTSREQALTWRDALTPEELEIFDRVAGDLNTELGYEPTASLLRRLQRRVARPKRPRRVTGVGENISEVRAEADDRSAKSAIIFLDELVAAMQAGKPEQAVGALAPGFTLEVVAGAERRSVNGDRARAALVDLLAGDPVVHGRQRRAEVFAKSSSVAAIIVFELPDGSESERIYVLGIERGRVARLIVYQLPERTAVRA